MEMKLV